MKDATDNGITASMVDPKVTVRKTWRNWFMLIGVLSLTVAGLIAALPPLIGGRLVNPWPWMKTDFMLLGGLSAVLALFIVYLTFQQRQVMRMNQNMEDLEGEMKSRMELHLNRLSALSQVSYVMGVETELDVIFDRLTETCMEKFESSRASLMLYLDDSRELVVKSISGDISGEIRNIKQPIDKGIAGWVARNGQPLLLNGPDDVAGYPELSLEDASVASAIVVPIIVRNELVGVLSISRNEWKNPYELEDLYALKIFALNAGSCIRHAEQIDWMRKLVPHLEPEVALETDGSSAGTIHRS